ncbi:MAG: SUF system NifU family Fe-S cluster assembly protein [Deltaproteobacteria bacterium]|jgi:nitrogen fixation NifU-like protein
MTDARALYRAWVLEHEKAPRNEGRLEDPTHSARGSNPLCGDRVDVDLKVEGDSIVRVAFESRGCAIAKASASKMTTLVDGRSPHEARALAERLTTLLARGNTEDDEALADLLGVRAFPSRTRCATLAWTTLVDALKESE